jgi:hypothetical protein
MLVACVAAGVLSLALVAGRDRRSLAFTLDVPAADVLVVQPGQQLCQARIDRQTGFDTVSIDYGTFGRPGPRMAITVADSSTGRTLARGVLPPGYADNHPALTRVSPALPAGAPIDVCARNTGSQRVALYGAPDWANVTSTGTTGRHGRYLFHDIAITFLRSHPRSVLSSVPDIFRRAAIFHPGWVGAWTFWLLLAAVVLAVPALLVRALGAAARESG